MTEKIEMKTNHTKTKNMITDFSGFSQLLKLSKYLNDFAIKLIVSSSPKSESICKGHLHNFTYKLSILHFPHPRYKL